MNLWLIPPLTLAALAAALYLIFYWTVRRRDLVRRPVERQVGYGFKRALLRAGHTVTVNYPSPVLQYDPMEYDLLIFGGSAYMGEVGRPLKNYLSSLRFRGKKVLLFVVGELERAPEMAGLRLCVPAGNQVRSIKIRPGQEKQLSQFALG